MSHRITQLGGSEGMTPFVLRPKERQVLEELTLHPPTAQSLRRAQALLWLDEGESVQEVAERLQISRQAVYKWITHFHVRATLPIPARVADGLHPGRPRTVWGVIDPLLAAVIESNPRDWGYEATVWPAPLLQQYLQEVHHLPVSRPSVSLALARLRLRWKRPRHHLARRSPTWRQAKGGLKLAWRRATAR
jgi:transposase